MKNVDFPKEIKETNRKGPIYGRFYSPKIVIFTDLDGTLLDHDTYDWRDAGPALQTCLRLGVPVIMVSSKTRSEMEILRSQLGLTDPYISENGGGIIFPEEVSRKPPPEAVLSGRQRVWTLGSHREDLIQAFRDIREEMGWKMRGFYEMDLTEIARLTGLDADACRLASLREYDEPFILEESPEKASQLLEKAADKRGLKISVGGRFFHLHGKNDKADAVKKLILWYEKEHYPLSTMALGDSPNDFCMLRVVDCPVLIRSGRRYPGIEKEIPGLTITEHAGPRGWNTAVNAHLEKWEGGFSGNV